MYLTGRFGHEDKIALTPYTELFPGQAENRRYHLYMEHYDMVHYNSLESEMVESSM